MRVRVFVTEYSRLRISGVVDMKIHQRYVTCLAVITPPGAPETGKLHSVSNLGSSQAFLTVRITAGARSSSIKFTGNWDVQTPGE